MLSGGELHVDMFDANFPGEVPTRAHLLAQRLRAAVNVRFQNAASKPDVLFTDRGRGLYQTNSGTITPDWWKQGVDENGFRTFLGDNAVGQPGSLQDILLQEQSTPKCWEEAREVRPRMRLYLCREGK